ncbi:MAG: acyl-CoA dehydrogenase family protein [Dehalococcoidales bacterium]|nr:acyl-CoA dehydrogenase family protein [Dehalococcoidales bacterium]
MDFRFSPEEENFRQEVAAFLKKEGPKEWHKRKVSFFDMSGQENWIAVHRDMSRKLGAKGWLSLHWPKEYGGKELSPFYRLILREELAKYHCPGYHSLSVDFVAPAILLKGSDELKKRFLPGIASGEVMWCEGLSEPGHGSDLAAIETFAKEDGDFYVVNGQKIWTTYAHFADWMFLLARTDRNAERNYRGLTFFLVDMKTPGITVNPIINMAGHHDFNEVFLDDVRIPKENIVDAVNKGWYVAMSVLDNERTSDLGYAIAGTLLDDIIEGAKEMDMLNARNKIRMAELYTECEIARLTHYHVTWMLSQGKPLDYYAAICKLLGFEAIQHVAEFGLEVFKNYGILSDHSPLAPLYGRISSCYLRSFGHSMEAGTSEMDRDVIAQRGMGLPRLR